jgi:hypothetical protein
MDWCTASTLFWCRVCYSLTTFSFFFFFFTVPFLSKVLTPTGFNALGQCAPFRFQRPKKKTPTKATTTTRKSNPGGGYCGTAAVTDHNRNSFSCSCGLGVAGNEQPEIIAEKRGRLFRCALVAPRQGGRPGRLCLAATTCTA